MSNFVRWHTPRDNNFIRICKKKIKKNEIDEKLWASNHEDESVTKASLNKKHDWIRKTKNLNDSVRKSLTKILMELDMHLTKT